MDTAMDPLTDDFDDLFDDKPSNSPHDSGWELYPSNEMDTNLNDVFDFSDGSDIGHDLVPEEQQAEPDVNVAQVPRYHFRSCNLRPGAKDDGKFVWITWLDTDDSGTYDPTISERRQRRSHKSSATRPQQQTRKQKPSENSDCDETAADEQEPMAARLSRLAAAQQGVSITVTLDLTTMALQSLAASIPDHWPGDEYNTLSDEHYLFLANQINNNADKWQPYNFRSRAVPLAEEEQNGSELVLAEGRIPDPLGNEVDLRHHPAARGCKECRVFDIKSCSLLDDEYSWPCRTCLEDDGDCQLIIPPKRKAACDLCRRRRLRCSYQTQGSDPSQPCTICAALNEKCVAAPAVGAIRERIRQGHDYSVPRPSIWNDRRYVTCTACRREKKRCSLQSKADAPPCLSCGQDNIECTFERLPPRRRERRSDSERNASGGEERSNLLVRHESSPNVLTIRSALNHPIYFLHDEANECTWCTKSIGVFGRGERDMIVMPSIEGLSYTEVKDDQTSDSEVCERMCVTCTMERCRIIGCGQHEMRHVNADDVNGMDLRAMYMRMLEGKPDPSDTWCSLCPAPALFSCCRLQTAEFWGESMNSTPSKAVAGCGLVLCEKCAVYLGKVGSLEKVIDAIKDKVTSLENWPLGGRADLDLLRQNGLLMRNVMADPDEDAEAEAMELDP